MSTHSSSFWAPNGDEPWVRLSQYWFHRGTYFLESVNFFPLCFTPNVVKLLPHLTHTLLLVPPEFLPQFQIWLNCFPTQKVGNLQEFIPLWYHCPKQPLLPLSAEVLDFNRNIMYSNKHHDIEENLILLLCSMYIN